jgi:hypothetical protein
MGACVGSAVTELVCSSFDDLPVANIKGSGWEFASVMGSVTSATAKARRGSMSLAPVNEPSWVHA